MFELALISSQSLSATAPYLSAINSLPRYFSVKSASSASTSRSAFVINSLDPIGGRKLGRAVGKPEGNGGSELGSGGKLEGKGGKLGPGPASGVDVALGVGRVGPGPVAG